MYFRYGSILEQGNHDTEAIQAKFDEMTLAINALQDEFYEMRAN